MTSLQSLLAQKAVLEKELVEVRADPGPGLLIRACASLLLSLAPSAAGLQATSVGWLHC